MSDTISRRNFMKGAVMAGIAAGMASTAMAAVDVPETWDYETDVVVCGCGAAGSAAAYEAATAGAEVIIVEKAPLPGGSMGRCGGAMAGAGTKFQAEAGIEDSADTYFEWMKVSSNGTVSEDILRVYADNSGPNVEWYNDLANEYLGYDIFLGQMATGMMNGLMAGGETYEECGWDGPTPVRGHWALCESDEANASGPNLYSVFLAALNAQDNVGALFSTALKHIVVNDDHEVIGIIAEDDAGEVAIKARKGVVLATGSYASSEDMKMQFIGPVVAKQSTCISDMCTGDGIRAGIEIGCGLAQTYSYYFSNNAQGAASEGTLSCEYHYDPQFEGQIYIWHNMEDDPNSMVTPPEAIHGLRDYDGDVSNCMVETHGGLVIDTDSQVYDVYGNVIPRLYASGTTVGTNVFGNSGRYPGCGCYVGFSVCYGRIAGQNVAALESWE